MQVGHYKQTSANCKAKLWFGLVKQLSTLVLDSASIRTRVLQAREVQAERFKHHHLAEAIHYLSLDREGWAG